jgi:hypothetical protein
VLEVGVSGLAGYSSVFTGPFDVERYLPTAGAVGILNADRVDPTGYFAEGFFGGVVVALQLNVDFGDYGFLASPSNYRLGDLRICGLTSYAIANGYTVRQWLAIANQALGGANTFPLLLDDISQVTWYLSEALEGGLPNSFAQIHLVNGTCP